MSPFWLGGTWGPMCHSGATLDLELWRPRELVNNKNPHPLNDSILQNSLCIY